MGFDVLLCSPLDVDFTTQFMVSSTELLLTLPLEGEDDADDEDDGEDDEDGGEDEEVTVGVEVVDDFLQAKLLPFCLMRVETARLLALCEKVFSLF